jgi:hypothetical protein
VLVRVRLLYCNIDSLLLMLLLLVMIMLLLLLMLMLSLCPRVV